MLACFIVGLAFVDRYNADFAAFLNVSLAQIGGVVMTIGAARLFRSVDASWSARRILRHGWRDLAALASGRYADLDGWTSHMLDRLLLITPRLALAEPGSALSAVDALKDLRIGRNVIQLRRALAAAPEMPGKQQPVQHVLAEVTQHFSRRASSGAPESAPATMLEVIDVALRALQAAPPDERRYQGLLALTGMRRNLFPDAPGYVGQSAL
jgi:uncharacterized membrane protein YccC